MKRSERRQRFTKITSIVGGGLGAAGGVALGDIFGAALGGVAGTALPWVVNALPILVDRTPGVGRWVRQKAVAREVKRKLELEFKASAPSDPEAALALLQEEARLIATTEAFGVPGTGRMVRIRESAQPAGSSGNSDIELLRGASPIRVVCPAICPSVVSVFKSLALRLKNVEVELQIDFSPANSGEITKRYASECWDFCAMSRLAILVTDPHVDEMLFQVAPLFSVSQYMLCRPLMRPESQPRRVLFVRESPSEAQYLSQQDIHQNAASDYIEQGEIVRMAETLRDDEYIIMWEPVAGWLVREYDLQVLERTTFNFLISLMVSVEWATRHGPDQISVFHNEFRREWDTGNRKRRDMLRLLTRDSVYLKAFSSSMGIH